MAFPYDVCVQAGDRCLDTNADRTDETNSGDFSESSPADGIGAVAKDFGTVPVAALS
jgi:hypothetical protein